MPSMNALHFFGPRCCMNFLHIVWQTSRISCASRHPQVAPVFRTRGKRPWTWNEPQASSASAWPDVPPPRSLKTTAKNSTKITEKHWKSCIDTLVWQIQLCSVCMQTLPNLTKDLSSHRHDMATPKRRLQKSSCENSDECWEVRKATAKTTAMNLVDYSINSCQNLERKWP